MATWTTTALSGADSDFDPRDPDDWLTWFVGVPLRIIFIIFLSAILLVLLRRLIRRITDHIASGTPLTERKGLRILGRSQVGSVLRSANPVSGARRAQRARTIGSVLRSTANIVIGVTAFLLVLSEIGVNLAPFFASAGIAGVALGFGAQSLVKDFLSGTFMLLEDQYGVGDVVDFGEVVGTVEEVALRVTKVRDVGGTLWYVRNGEILRTGNKTQEWGRAVVQVRVAYYADVEEVRAVLLRAAERLRGDPALGVYLLEPAEVLGIEDMTAEALLMKVQVKTQAAMQWEIARNLRSEIRKGLESAGIPLAGAQQVVIYDHSPAQPGDPTRVDGAAHPRNTAPAGDTRPGGGQPGDDPGGSTRGRGQGS